MSINREQALSQSQSESRTKSSFEVRLEKLKDMLADGLDELAQADYEEIESDTHLFAYAPDWDEFLRCERQGLWKVFAARLDGQLVGYSSFYLMPHMHAKGMKQAVNNVIYLMPEHRRAWRGVRMIRTAEAILRGAGAQRILYASRPSYPKTGALLEKLGYTLFETTFAKVL